MNQPIRYVRSEDMADLLRRLGLDPSLTHGISIILEAGQLAIVRVEQYLAIPPSDIIQRTYRLVDIEAESETISVS